MVRGGQQVDSYLKIQAVGMRQPKITKTSWCIYFEVAGKIMAAEDSRDQQKGTGVACQCDHCPESVLEQGSIQGRR